MVRRPRRALQWKLPYVTDITSLVIWHCIKGMVLYDEDCRTTSDDGKEWMMLIYPSSESKTNHTSPPWVAMILVLISVGAFLGVHGPAARQAKLMNEEAAAILSAVLDNDVANRKLGEKTRFKVKQDPSLVGRSEMRDTFSAEARAAYQNWINTPKPMEIIARSGPIRKLLLTLTPHGIAVLIVGCLCLLLQGFLFEHLYDRLLPAAIFATSAALWLILDQKVPDPYWPSPLFAWANTVAVMTLFMWLAAPRAKVYLTIKVWLFRVFEIQPALPNLLFPTAFLGTYLGVLFYASPYGEQANPIALIAVGGQALLFYPVLMAMTRRDDAEEAIGETNQMIARAESLFDEDKSKDAFLLLRKMMESDLDEEQLRRVADLAWRNHDNEIAKQGYRTLLKLALTGQEVHKLMAIIEDMNYKELDTPGAALTTAINLGLKKNMMQDVRKLLSYFRDHPEIEAEARLDFHARLVEKLVTGANPDKQYLAEVLEWLRRHHPDADATQRAELFFSQSRDSVKSSPMIGQKIHKHVEAVLIEVNSKTVRMRVDNRSEQEIPWSAVVAFFGAHMTGEKRGFRGSVMLKFKRKIFSCTFDRNNIEIKDPIGQTMTFEAAWGLLEKNAPEDAPFLPMSKFEDMPDEKAFEEACLTFINKDFMG